MPYAVERVPIYLECLIHAMLERGIDKPERQAAFLAQVAHESGSLRYTLEIADGRAYDIMVNPTKANDLGNLKPGDGPKYKGRGLIQITGRTNTEACLTALGRKLDDITYLETPMGASRSAAWFWQSRGLNELADQSAFGTITKRINGGYNGLDDRIRHYLRIRKVYGI